jgi:hypothetical protein
MGNPWGEQPRSVTHSVHRIDLFAILQPSKHDNTK